MHAYDARVAITVLWLHDRTANQDAINVGDEGGFAPGIGGNEECLDLIKKAIEQAGYTGRIEYGMDVAASEFLTKDGAWCIRVQCVYMCVCVCVCGVSVCVCLCV
mgnify:CR=1 FL=1